MDTTITPKKVVTLNLYSFDQLSEKVQEKILSKYSEVNVDYEWWDNTYEDAANVGVKITSFDIGRRNDITGTSEWINTANKIIAEHGDVCDTYKTAKKFIEEYNKFEEGDEDIDDLEEQFTKDILNDYLTILKEEYEYLITDEAIKETIISNEYLFDIDGKRYNL